MAQGELFKGMSEKELVAEAQRLEKAGTRKRATKKGKSKKGTYKKSAGKTASRTQKKFYTVQVPMGASVTINPACKTAKPTKRATSKKRKTRRSKGGE